MKRGSLWSDSGASMSATISMRSMQTWMAPVCRRLAMYVSSEGTTSSARLPASQVVAVVR